MHGLATWLRGQDIDARIVAGHSAPQTYAIQGIPYQTVRAWNLRRWHPELGPAVTMIPAMAARLRRLRPTIVHAFSYHDAIAAKLAGVPYLISYAGIIAPRSWRRAPWQYRLFRKASRDARAIFTPSNACAVAFLRDYDLHTELIPYGLDTATFARPAVRRVPGRIMCAATPDDARKRPDFLVQAFAQVAERDPHATLVFCASASSGTQKRLLGLLPERLRARVSFLGNIDRDRLREEYAKAALTVLTSVEEAFGLVLIESFAAGTPVVATHSGAVPELVDASVGRTFARDDVEGCANAMTDVLRAEPAAFAAACRRHARQYDWDAVGPRMLDLYRRCATT
jgi:glycosyltransferase involved in cell wall biosynthesis